MLLLREETPYKQSYGLKLVNTEHIKWVSVDAESSACDQKPDFAACYPWLFESKAAYNTESPGLKEARTKVSEEMDGEIIYGKPFWKSRDGIETVFETKRCYTSEGLGELVNYQAHICKGMGSNIVSKGVLLWNKGFMLVRVQNQVPVSICKALWTSSGSKKLFEDFVKPDNKIAWMTALQHICEAQKLQLVDHGFLGHGSSGHVFQVRTVEGVLCALKVVTGTAEVVGLEREYDAIACMHTKYSQLQKNSQLQLVDLANHPFIKVPSIWRDSVSSVVPAAAYLMSDVGTPALCSTYQQRLEIFISLSKFHQAGYVHGDPRIANVIMIGGDLRWIDVMSSGGVFSAVD